MNQKFTAKIDRLSFPEGVKSVLHEITLEFAPGEMIFLSGAPSSGKSSLCQVLAGIIPNYTEGLFTGHIELNGESIVVKHLPEVAGKIGYVKDDPQSQLFCATVEEDLAFGPCNILLDPVEVRNRIHKCLEFVGLKGYEKRKSETLSGGEAQRIALASMLTLSPEIIILDEALTQLDSQGKKRIYEQLSNLAVEEKKIIIIVEKKLENYLYLASRLLMLDEGKIIYDGCPKKEALTKAKEITKIHDKVQQDQLIELSHPIIRVENLSFHYPDGQIALEDISLEVNSGEFIALMGKNGAGKTTLAKHFNGLHQPSEGTVFVNEMNTKNHSIAQLSNQVGYLFQNPQMQICTNSVEEEVGFALKVRRLPKKVIASKVASVLSKMKLMEYSKDHPYALTKSNVQKLAIASSLINEPQIIIVDEPTSQMSTAQSFEIMELIYQYNQKGVTVVMVSHDLHLALHYASRIVVLDHGQIALDIPTMECFEYEQELSDLGLELKEVESGGEKTYEAVARIQ